MKGMRISILASVGAATISAVYSPQDVGITKEEFLAIAALAVSTAERSARSDTENRGPLLLDLTSINQAVRPIMADSITLDDLQGALLSPFRVSAYDDVVTCTTSTRTSCGIVDDGVFLQLENLVVRGPAVVMYLFSATTFLSPDGSEVCPSLFRIAFVKQESAGWVLLENDLEMSC